MTIWGDCNKQNDDGMIRFLQISDIHFLDISGNDDDYAQMIRVCYIRDENGALCLN